MKLNEKYGSWACVLGAAEGLGAAFSMQLAKHRFDLILVDKLASQLEATEKVIQEQHEVEIIRIIADLSETNCLEPILKIMTEKDCRFMIYNAAYGPVKPFLSNSKSELDFYLNVNMATTLHLVHRFIQLNKDKKAGILLLSSLAGFRGTQYVVPYAATKAFLWNLAEGLHYEFKDSLLDVTVCCPGTIDTPGFRSTNPKQSIFTPKPMTPEAVAKEALSHFGKKLFIIPGASNKISHFILNRILPRRWASSIHNYAMKKLYG
jgi:short-subunit dehydrogenase